MSAFDDVEAIFFDIDNTVYDFRHSMRLAFERLAHKYDDQLQGTSAERLGELYWAHYDAFPAAEKLRLIHTDPEEFRRAMWRGCLQNGGIHQDAATTDEIARLLVTDFGAHRPQEWRAAMYPGAHDTLLALRAGPAIIGGITNGPQGVQRPKVEGLEFRRYWPEELMFVSGEFGVDKPAPEIFLAAADAAKTDPERCLMIGDAHEFDMPAKRVGFKTILFTGSGLVDVEGGHDDCRPDAIAADYGELRTHLEHQLAR